MYSAVYIYSNIRCSWLINAPVGYIINLTFVDSDIQTSQPCTNGDFVSVYDGKTCIMEANLLYMGSNLKILKLEYQSAPNVRV